MNYIKSTNGILYHNIKLLKCNNTETASDTVERSGYKLILYDLFS